LATSLGTDPGADPLTIEERPDIGRRRPGRLQNRPEQRRSPTTDYPVFGLTGHVNPFVDIFVINNS
jgi:hypothetical protein